MMQTIFLNFTGRYYPALGLKSDKNNEQCKYTYAPPCRERSKNRDNDLHTVVEEEAALDELGLRELLFIDWIGSSRYFAKDG